MLQKVAEGVLVHVSEFLQSNSIVVQGPTGALPRRPAHVTVHARHASSTLITHSAV
jgi:hypothetical protein